MDLISGYPSDGEEPLEDTPLQPVQRITHTGLGAKSSAPVSTVAIANTQSLKRSMADGQNVGVDIMLAPEVGPHNPFSGPTASGGGGSIVSKNGIGVVEDTFVEDYAFNSAYQSYLQEDLKLVPKTKQIRTERQPKKAKLMKDLPADIGDESLGPWCDASSLRPVPTGVKRGPQDEEGPEPEAEDNEETAVAEDPSMHILEPDEEDEKWEKVNERKASFVMPPRPVRGSMAGEAKSTFHGPEERDYQGRPWTTAPSGVRPGDGDHDCFIPKKCIKKFVGHSKGVQAIELFPGTGHLLLSGSLDGKCKVWDVMSHRNVMRTYHGHTEAVRSIHMSNDGSQFLSSGFDRYVRLWDLETGQAVGTFSNRKMHYQVKFSPNNNNVFLCASSDNKIYQWDTRSGEVVQEYNYHLQPCNTITFFDDGRKFLSTSDDKKMLVWETDIPVPIKYIAEPDMHRLAIDVQVSHMCIYECMYAYMQL
jgi:pre-mRNA-processing factor 17